MMINTETGGFWQTAQESRLSVLRLALSAFFLALFLGVQHEVPAAVRSTSWGILAIHALLSTGVFAYVRLRGAHRFIPVLTFVTDFLLITALMLSFRGAVMLKSEAFALYYLWIVLSALRGSVLTTLLAGVLSMLSLISLFLWSLHSGGISTGTMGEAVTTAAVSPLSIWLRACLIAAVSLITAFTAKHWHRADTEIISRIEGEVLREQQLRKSEGDVSHLRMSLTHLDQESTLKSEYLANISHELRTPLNAVIGLSQILGDEAFGELNEKQKEFITGITDSGKRLLEIVNDIIELSGFQSEREQPSAAPFSPAAMLSNIQQSLGGSQPEASTAAPAITLDTRLAPPQFHTDERMLKRIVTNVLRAMRNLSAGDTAPAVRASTTAGALTIEITAEAAGITDRELSTLLTGAFLTLSRSAPSAQRNTGLQFIIATTIADLINASISATRSEGDAITITITCPALGEPESQGLNTL